MTTSVKSTIATLTIVAVLLISVISAYSAELIDINTANETELTMMMRVGPVLAKRIVQYRTDNGEFMSVDDLMNVMGIGSKILEMNRASITVNYEAVKPVVETPVVETPVVETPVVETPVVETPAVN